MPRSPHTDELLERLGIQEPIIQAPMAGGATTPELVSAVSEAGALGFLGAAYLTEEAIATASAEVRRRTSRPFGINLFAPLPEPPAVDVSRMLELLAPVHARLGLAPPEAPSIRPSTFDAQLDAVLDTDATVFSFTFGLLSDGVVGRLHAREIFVMGTATTVDEALQLEAAGVDAIVVQGSEAGAHRGTFGGPFEAAMIGTMALVPQVVDAVRVPVVASGGIMDGRGIAAALALGASAAQLGTAFLTCPESGIPASHKQAILGGREDATRITRAFSGRPARGLVNPLMDRIDAEPDAIPPFPLQNAVTRPIRTAAAAGDDAAHLSLWAGQGVRMARRLPAADLVAALAEELASASRQLTSASRSRRSRTTR
jgi:nitronate monooxygenase